MVGGSPEAKGYVSYTFWHSKTASELILTENTTRHETAVKVVPLNDYIMISAFLQYTQLQHLSYAFIIADCLSLCR